MEIAGSLESKSKHPLAEAVVKYTENNSITLLDVKNFESVTGKGVKGQINKKMFYVGRKSLLTIYNKFPNDLIEKLEVNGKTVLIILIRNMLLV